MSLDNQLDELAKLEFNWDGYSSPPIGEHAIARLRQLHFSPVGDAGIQIDLSDGDKLLEVYIDANGRIRGVGLDELP